LRQGEKERKEEEETRRGERCLSWLPLTLSPIQSFDHRAVRQHLAVKGKTTSPENQANMQKREEEKKGKFLFYRYHII